MKFQVSFTIVAIALLFYRWNNLQKLQASVQFGGTCEGRFAEVREAFRMNFEKGLEGEGAAFAVYWRGKKVVDLWGGFADRETEKVWKQDTIAVAHSTTKGVAAISLALLYDRNKFSYDDNVTKYWPEFGHGGKEQITIKQLVNHQSGVCCLDDEDDFHFLDLNNTEKISRILEKKKPYWKPGSAAGYHAITFGLLVDQLIRRLDEKNRSVGQFFREEIAQPFGIDFHVGLPSSEHHRMARLKNTPLKIVWQSIYDPTMRKAVISSVTGARSPLLLRSVSYPDPATLTYITQIHKFNQPDFIRMELASSTGIGTAESLAKLFSLLVDGQGRLLKTETVDLLSTPLLTEPDILMFFPNVSRGWGFQYFDEEGHWVFGHPGFGGQMAFADPVHQLAIAYVTSDNGGYFSSDDPRFMALRDAVYRGVRSKQVKTETETETAPSLPALVFTQTS